MSDQPIVRNIGGVRCDVRGCFDVKSHEGCSIINSGTEDVTITFRIGTWNGFQEQIICLANEKPIGVLAKSQLPTMLEVIKHCQRSSIDMKLSSPKLFASQYGNTFQRAEVPCSFNLKSTNPWEVVYCQSELQKVFDSIDINNDYCLPVAMKYAERRKGNVGGHADRGERRKGNEGGHADRGERRKGNEGGHDQSSLSRLVQRGGEPDRGGERLRQLLTSNEPPLKCLPPVAGSLCRPRGVGGRRKKGKFRMGPA